jgi:imidazolonepropionase-like amidohydrolase
MSKLASFLLLFVSVMHAQAVVGTDAKESTTIRYTLLIAGNKSGLQTTTQNADGSLQMHFEFNDRGRGPNIDERMVLAKNGAPLEIETKGTDYYKAAVEEHFSLNQGTAAWKNRAEEGQKQDAGDAFYIGLSGTPEEGAVLARALLQAPGHKLRLLPEGEASLERLSDLKLEANGQSRTFVQYSVSGLNFVPFPIWLSDDGKVFASVSDWFSLVPEGWESIVDPISQAQQTFANARAGKLAATLGRKPAGGLAFVHASVFDSVNAEVHRNYTVVIAGNKIAACGPDGKINVPKGAEVIDAAGKFLMPGLWDMHVHLQPNDGLLHIAAGVTSVRDLANDTEGLMKMRDRFDQGSEIGPHVLMAGFIDGRGPFQGPTKVFADTEDEAKKDVDNYARLGYVQIKIYSSVKPELVPVIAGLAHSHGLRVSGHVPSGMIAEQFVRAGADEIQHMNFIFLNFMPQVKDTRGMARFTEVSAHAAEIDPSSAQVKAFIHLLQEHKTVVDPTLAIFEGDLDRPGKVSVGYAAVADRMPAQVRRGFLYGGLPVPEGLDQRYRDSFQQMLKMAKTFYDSGITLVAGTDSLAGFTLHRELELYQQAGIPAPKVLQLATFGAARVMKRESEVGSIASGQLADVILVDGDPSRSISDIRRVKTVVKDGVVYQTADLDRALGVKPIEF